MSNRAHRDDNDVPSLLGVSNVDTISVVDIYADPVTHALLVDTSTSTLVITQETSTTTPNGITQTFSFTHTPQALFWNGQFQTLNTDYTVSGSSITFAGSLIPQTGDLVVNVYGS